MLDTQSEPNLATIEAMLAKRKEIAKLKAAERAEQDRIQNGQHGFVFRTRDEDPELEKETEKKRFDRLMSNNAAWDRMT